MRKGHLGVVSALLVLWLLANTAYPAVLSEIEKQLMCQCGCAMVLASCQCSTADQMRAEIQAKLDKGTTGEQILADYVAMYGEKVLSAPTKRGFNLTAWVMPFVAVLAGLGLLGLIVREFVRRGRARSPGAQYSDEALTQFRGKVDEELKDYL